MFATRSDLLARSNARRLAQLAVPADVVMVPDDALRIAIAGGDLSAFTAADQAALTLALAAIDTVLADADAMLLSHGIPAAPSTTPAALSQLARMSSTVALYYLQGSEQMTDTVKTGYDDVAGKLMAHSQGKINLVPPATPPIIPLSEDQVLFASAPRRYGSTVVPGDW
jgi:phage gp36-like protein